MSSVVTPSRSESRKRTRSEKTARGGSSAQEEANADVLRQALRGVPREVLQRVLQEVLQAEPSSAPAPQKPSEPYKQASLEEIVDELITKYGKPVRVPGSNVMLFGDGSVLSEGFLTLAPCDPREQYERRKKYYHVALPQAENAYDKLRKAIRDDIDTCREHGWSLPWDAAQARRDLQAARDRVDRLREEYDDLTKDERERREHVEQVSAESYSHGISEADAANAALGNLLDND